MSQMPDERIPYTCCPWNVIIKGLPRKNCFGKNKLEVMHKNQCRNAGWIKPKVTELQTDPKSPNYHTDTCERERATQSIPILP